MGQASCCDLWPLARIPLTSPPRGRRLQAVFSGSAKTELRSWVLVRNEAELGGSHREGLGDKARLQPIAVAVKPKHHASGFPNGRTVARQWRHVGFTALPRGARTEPRDSTGRTRTCRRGARSSQVAVSRRCASPSCGHSIPASLIRPEVREERLTRRGLVLVCLFLPDSYLPS